MPAAPTDVRLLSPWRHQTHIHSPGLSDNSNKREAHDTRPRDAIGVALVTRSRSGGAASVLSFGGALAPGTRGLRLIERHARLYRRMWLIVVAGGGGRRVSLPLWGGAV